MTRTARRSKNKEPLPATPWEELSSAQPDSGQNDDVLSATRKKRKLSSRVKGLTGKRLLNSGYVRLVESSLSEEDAQSLHESVDMSRRDDQKSEKNKACHKEMRTTVSVEEDSTRTKRKSRRSVSDDKRRLIHCVKDSDNSLSDQVEGSLYDESSSTKEESLHESRIILSQRVNQKSEKKIARQARTASNYIAQPTSVKAQIVQHKRTKRKKRRRDVCEDEKSLIESESSLSDQAESGDEEEEEEEKIGGDVVSEDGEMDEEGKVLRDVVSEDGDVGIDEVDIDEEGEHIQLLPRATTQKKKKKRKNAVREKGEGDKVQNGDEKKGAKTKKSSTRVRIGKRWTKASGASSATKAQGEGGGEEERGEDVVMKKRKRRMDEESKRKRIEHRRLRRQRKKVCFNCRQAGHWVGDCPLSSTSAGICFKCGSSEHTCQQCGIKVPSGEFPYAKCFICGEMGHLSRSCPDNPRGLYPRGGGCKLCGSVEHLKANCPSNDIKVSNKDHSTTADRTVASATITKSADALDDTQPPPPARKKLKTKQKVVIF